MAYKIKITKAAVGQIVELENEGVSFAELFTFGSVLNQFGIFKDGKAINVIEGYKSPEDCKATQIPAFASAKLSPFVCRLANASFDFEGKKYSIQKHNDGNSAIHGLVFDQIFHVLLEETSDECAKVVFKLDIDFAAQGFPFPYLLEVEYTLRGDTLRVETYVKNEGTTSMPINDGWHPYFTFGRRIDTAEIEFRSKAQFVFDDTLLPTGETVPYTTFNQPKPIGDTFWDNSFALNEADAAALILTSPEDKIAIDVLPESGYPILQIYTPPHRQSIAVENLTSIPDSFNNKIGLTILDAGEEQRFVTSYRVRKI